MEPFRLDQLLSEAAARTPHATAVRAGEACATWGELDAAADRVAACLVELGVGIGDRVGLYVDKGLVAVTALYGIMRAGAGYVPIDPSGPTSRAAAIADDCGLVALVSDDVRARDLQQLLPQRLRGLVCGGPVDGFIPWDDVLSGDGHVPRRQLVETDLAYILYTSGSTGRPKGVAITHRSALTFVLWARDTFALRPDDVLSNHAPLHFDLSTLDLFGAASVGASTSIVPATAFPVQLARWIDEAAISVWYSVPTALSLLVRYGDLASLPLSALRLVLFAGEVFPNRYLSELMHQVPHPRYYNLFGPTETNVCTYYEVAEPPPPTGSVPIGRGCANHRCEVVDESGATRHEPGAEGELVVTGPGVASGYWGDVDRSAERFARPHTYRTGDVVQIMEDGDNPLLRFLGRRDHLVKTRGYRVELGEVEAALYAHHAVRECAAVPVPDDTVGNRIVAFCSVAGEVEVDALLEACRQRLPGYMVPEHVLVTEALPMTANGKCDRQALTARAQELWGVHA